MSGTNLASMDSLFSTVQMPRGIPVATLAIGKAGAVNAAYLAVQILALNDENLALALQKDRQAQENQLIADSKSVEVLL